MPFRSHAGFGESEVQRVIAATAQIAVNRDQILHTAHLGRENDPVVSHPELLRAPPAFQCREHDGVAHDLLRAQRLRARGILIHQPREQVLVEAAPVDADTDRLAVAAGHLDHLRELRVALAAAPDVAWVDAVLGQRLGAARVLAQQLVAIEMKVADQRHRHSELIEAIADVRHGLAPLPPYLP